MCIRDSKNTIKRVKVTMRAKKLLEMLDEGESSTLEFKRRISSYEKIAKEMTAFANTKGGYIIVGVDDDGTIVGVESDKGIIDQIEKASEFYVKPPLAPEIEIVSIYDKDVIVCYIAESERKPHELVKEGVKVSAAQVYIRVGEQSLLASKEMKRLLSSTNPDAKPVRLIIGDKEKRLFAYMGKYGKATVKDFSKLVNISNRRSERLLVRLVKAGVLQIHIDTTHDYFTLLEKIK